MTAFTLVILAVMVVGLVGVLVPLLPGLLLIWAAALAYGVVTGFSVGGWVFFAVITLLMLVGSVVDNFIMGAKARGQGASWPAIAVALVAGVVGSLVFPPFGGLIAAVVGLFLVEYLRLRSARRAMASTKGWAVGCGWATIVRFGLGMLMILLWGAWVKWA